MKNILKKIKNLLSPDVAKRSSVPKLSDYTVNDLLCNSIIIEQNNVSVRFSNSHNVTIHYLEKNEPNSITCTLNQIIQPFLNNLENDSENAISISFPKDDSKTD